MSTESKQKTRKGARALTVPATLPSQHTPFDDSLTALKKVIDVAVNGERADSTTLTQLDFYLATLQDGADLVNVALYQQTVSNLLQLITSLDTIQGVLLDPNKLAKAVEEDRDYGLNLLKALYKEVNVSKAFLDSKSARLFNVDSMKKSPLMAPSTDSVEASKQVMKLPSSRREALRNLLTKLLSGSEEKDITPPTKKTKKNDRPRSPRTSRKKRSPKDP